MADGARHADLVQLPDWNDNLANAFETPVTLECLSTLPPPPPPRVTVLITSTRTKTQSALRASELEQMLRSSTL